MNPLQELLARLDPKALNEPLLLLQADLTKLVEESVEHYRRNNVVVVADHYCDCDA